MLITLQDHFNPPKSRLKQMMHAANALPMKPIYGASIDIPCALSHILTPARFLPSTGEIDHTAVKHLINALFLSRQTLALTYMMR